MSGTAPSPEHSTGQSAGDFGSGSSGGHVIYEGSSARKVLLIVFAFVNQPVGTRSHSTFLAGIDCKKLFLNPGCNSWYQTGVPGFARDYHELLANVRQVAQLHADHEILCLGHSMGGFAALGIGCAVGAHRILASVPELRLGLPGSVSRQLLGGVAIQCGDLTETLRQGTRSRITLIVGRDNTFDIGMADEIAALTGALRIELPCGHNTFPFLKEQGELHDYLLSFVDGKLSTGRPTPRGPGQIPRGTADVLMDPAKSSGHPPPGSTV